MLPRGPRLTEHDRHRRLGVPTGTLRKIETGRIATAAFFTLAIGRLGG
jgi:hypothetical protein